MPVNVINHLLDIRVNRDHTELIATMFACMSFDDKCRLRANLDENELALLASALGCENTEEINWGYG